MKNILKLEKQIEYQNKQLKMDTDIPIDRKLAEMFEEGYHLYDSFDTRQEPTNSEAFQVEKKHYLTIKS